MPIYYLIVKDMKIDFIFYVNYKMINKDILSEIMKWLNIEDLLKLRKINKFFMLISSKEFNYSDFYQELSDDFGMKFILFDINNEFSNKKLEFSIYILNKKIYKEKICYNFEKYLNMAIKSHIELLKIILNICKWKHPIIYQDSFNYIKSYNKSDITQLLINHFQENIPPRIYELQSIRWHMAFDDFKKNKTCLITN